MRFAGVDREAANHVAHVLGFGSGSRVLVALRTRARFIFAFGFRGSFRRLTIRNADHIHLASGRAFRLGVFGILRRLARLRFRGGVRTATRAIRISRVRRRLPVRYW